MDRSVLEGDPHAVLEAMAIAGYAIGADEGYIYVRAEYPIAVHRLEIALKQAREYGLLGKNIFGTGFNFDITIRLGAGAFVCGEETALLTSIEGNRGEPRPRPPFPGGQGSVRSADYHQQCRDVRQYLPDYSERSGMVRFDGYRKVQGHERYSRSAARSRTPDLSKSRWVLRCARVVEVIGGGVPNGKKFKAAQTGGPSGGCIPASLIDTPIDYDNLIAIGSMMGSGGLIIMDEDTLYGRPREVLPRIHCRRVLR